MILIERKDVKHYKFSSPIPSQLATLKDCLKIWIDGAQYSDKFKRGFWDGYFRLYSKYNEFEIGLLDEVVFHLKENNIKYEIEESDFRERKVSDFSLDNRLRPHQKEGVEAFFESNYGLMVIPTRGGKTFVSGEIIKHVTNQYMSSTVLFYVDTTDLFDQTVEEISKYLNISEDEIGTINAFGVNVKQVTVAMIQTVTSIFNRKKPESKQLEKYFKKLTFLIVDEVQEYLGDNRMKLIKKCKNVDFLLGLSATPFKQQGNMTLNLKMKGYFGGVVYDVQKERLQDEGYLALDKAILIAHEHGNSKIEGVGELVGTEKYQALLKKSIHENKSRNKILLDLINMCRRNKWKTLMLFNSKQHGYLISDLADVVFLSGDDDSKKRKDEKERFLRGRGKILLASNIFKKGITLPEVEVLILADGGLEGSNVIQKTGRVLGAVECKDRAVVMDIMDVNCEYFSDHSLNRLEVYSDEIGDDRIECYEDDDLSDVEDSIKSWFDEK
jgi:superfamily II DNA or RNA helicase